MEPLTRTASTEPDRTPVTDKDEGVLRVSLLGRFEVSVGSRVLGEEGWRLRKAAGLVKLLALAPHHRLHQEQLMAALWPDLVPTSAANNLHQTLHAARRTLEPEARDFRYLIPRDELLLLCPDGALRVDVDTFEEAAAEARRSGEPAAYRRVLELYTGDLLPRDQYEDWAEERWAGLRQEYLALLSGLAAIYEVPALDPYPSDPARLLGASKKYRAVVTTSAQDLNGQALTSTYAGIRRRGRASIGTHFRRV